MTAECINMGSYIGNPQQSVLYEPSPSRTRDSRYDNVNKTSRHVSRERNYPGQIRFNFISDAHSARCLMRYGACNKQ